MSTTQLPRREPTLADVIDVRPWDVPPTPVNEAQLDVVLDWLDDPTV
ncbi:MAG TPA: hypothetical protein VFL94_15305 [Actinomycetales bacterium]|nr:hypothetical protein [Actinomycetales bacterium]